MKQLTLTQALKDAEVQLFTSFILCTWNFKTAKQPEHNTLVFLSNSRCGVPVSNRQFCQLGCSQPLGCVTLGWEYVTTKCNYKGL